MAKNAWRLGVVRIGGEDLPQLVRGQLEAVLFQEHEGALEMLVDHSFRYLRMSS